MQHVLNYYEKFSDMFAALSNQTRLRVYRLLLEKELCVCELEGLLEIEQSRISHCLKELKRAGLVGCRPAGKKKIYSAEYSALSGKIIRGLKEELTAGVVYKNNIKGK